MAGALEPSQTQTRACLVLPGQHCSGLPQQLTDRSIRSTVREAALLTGWKPSGARWAPVGLSAGAGNSSSLPLP